MKKMLAIISLIAALMLITACTQQNTTNTPGQNIEEPIACTMEAKVCPDGSYVGRNSQNNCEFDPCPEAMILCTGDVRECSDGSFVGRDANNNCEFQACPSEDLKNPTLRNYATDSPETCAATTFICEGKSKVFFDSTGCGCEVDEPRRYVSNSPEQCTVIRYVCQPGEEAFSNEYGCGCEWIWNQPEEETGGKLQAIDCTDPRPTACTKEYMPVCGQVQVECIRAPCPPMKQTFGNKCEACSNRRTISYTQGACEDSNPAGGTHPAFENQCTAAQKAAEACTMQYDPVCGDDGQTYSNSCGACSSGNVDAWYSGECVAENAFT